MVFNPLYIVWNFNPVLFSVGGLDIRYYGLMWALAILVGAKFFDNFCKREGLPSSVSESIFIYGTLATIIGSRLGHCLFTSRSTIFAHPLAIITEIRNGGMASHGAAVGLLIGLWLFFAPEQTALSGRSTASIPVAIGGAAVRFGNLFNSEIVGSVTDMPWASSSCVSTRDLPLDAVPVQHPTQLYRSVVLCGDVRGCCGWLYYRRRVSAGRVLFGVGLIGVFLTRFSSSSSRRIRRPSSRECCSTWGSC